MFWEGTQLNGVYGRKVTGPNCNSIFLPAAGHRDGTNLYNAGSRSNFWSSSLRTDYPYYARILFFNSDVEAWNDFERHYGYSIRPVCE